MTRFGTYSMPQDSREKKSLDRNELGTISGGVVIYWRLCPRLHIHVHIMSIKCNISASFFYFLYVHLG